jgi:hypothetical protein
LDIAAQIEGRGGIWRRAEPASLDALEALRAALPTSVPDAYFEFLRFTNGGEGDISVEPGWLCPWPAEDVLLHNEGYKIAELYGNFLGFGSNGGGELIAFDCRAPCPWPIVMIPWIGGTEHCERIADDFPSLLACIGRSIDQSDA